MLRLFVAAGRCAGGAARLGEHSPEFGGIAHFCCATTTHSSRPRDGSLGDGLPLVVRRGGGSQRGGVHIEALRHLKGAMSVHAKMATTICTWKLHLSFTWRHRLRSSSDTSRPSLVRERPCGPA